MYRLCKATLDFKIGYKTFNAEERADFYRKSSGLCGAQLAKVRRVERQDGQDRALVSAVYSQVMRRGFGLDTTDVNGCPKLMPRGVFEGLDLRSQDWFLDAETLLKAQEQHLKIAEVEATMLPETHTVNRCRFNLKANWTSGERPRAPLP